MGYRRYYKSFRFKSGFGNEEKQINFIKSCNEKYLNDLENEELPNLFDVEQCLENNVIWNKESNFNGYKSYFIINVNQSFNNLLTKKSIYYNGHLSEVGNNSRSYFYGSLVIKAKDIKEWFWDNFIENGKYKEILGHKLSEELECEINDDTFFTNKFNRIPYQTFISAHGHQHYLKGMKIYQDEESEFWYALADLLKLTYFSGDYIFMEEF